ncbi:molybdopterin dinucleotide binding domain-containing protein [Desulforamulus profundi]|uniref:molybdopterin dinucleotide binding domain-containing protein n=1 Tax=Desulforamulus profundi TaxID=1383067 RepID=UPI001EE625DB|nr:molybdopterin dinucleotide binding domain-containing protein [Desulforamulus profundi]
MYEEPAESSLRDAALAKSYPLHLISAHHPDYLHSQFWNLNEKYHQVQPVYLHPDTAAAAGIRQDQPVVVATRRGEAVFKAVISDIVRPDTALVYQATGPATATG